MKKYTITAILIFLGVHLYNQNTNRSDMEQMQEVLKLHMDGTADSAI